MSNETLFFICGIALACSAVVFSLIGLKVKDFPGRAMPLIVLWFAILVVGSTTFAVLHAKDEDAAKAAEFEHAGKEIEKEQTSGPYEKSGAEKEGAEEGQPSEGATGKAPAEETLELAASKTELAFDTKELSAKAGEVTIDFENPSAIGHDVAIEQNGKEIAKTEVISESSASVSANLKPGTYTFLCTVPGHATAGMEGTLTVK
jgi:plastocyanin